MAVINERASLMMTERRIKIKPNRPVNQDYIRSIETMLETVWTRNSFCVYALIFSDATDLYIDYPTDLAESQAYEDIRRVGIQSWTTYLR